MPGTVRVELHAATGENYEALHQAMERKGFIRIAIDSTGSIVKLPTGFYYWADERNEFAALVSAAETAREAVGLYSSIVATCGPSATLGCEKV